MCITSDNKVGIGTDSPTTKLDVNGTIRGTDVCNTTGNCLSALATLTNACGAAATTYIYTATGFSGTYCVMGVSTPAAPTFPAAGSSTTWTCPVTSGSPVSCTATHTAAPVNGVCGAAAVAYPYSSSALSGALCSTGTASPTNPSFPAAGSSTSWSCLGTNGGASPSCTASRNNPLPLVNSTHNEQDCITAGGTVVAANGSYNQCRFNTSVCPSLWTQFNNWSTNTEVTCTYCPTFGLFYAGAGCTCGPTTATCTATGNAWGNSRASCSVPLLSCSDAGGLKSTGGYTCWPTTTQIGCY